RIVAVEQRVNALLADVTVCLDELQRFRTRQRERKRVGFIRLQLQNAAAIAASHQLGERECEGIQERHRDLRAVLDTLESNTMNGVRAGGARPVENQFWIGMDLPQQESVRPPDRWHRIPRVPDTALVAEMDAMLLTVAHVVPGVLRESARWLCGKVQQ